MNRTMAHNAPKALAISLALAFAPGAHAVTFELDNGAKVIWTTTVSAGTSVRNESADPKLVHPNNAALYGIGGALGGNTDDGTLNFEKGRAFSSPLKVVTDVEYKGGDWGAFIRGKAWYDYTLENKGVRHGSFANGYQPGAKLNDSNYEDLAKFSGAALLDAYVYGGFKIGDNDGRVRLGRHVLNWGESAFIQGVNQINPIDVPALRRPGTEIKEVLLPVGMLSANMGLGKGVSLEGFYQFEWQNSVLDGCGTYFLAVDASVGPNARNACASGFMQSLTAAQAAQLSALLKTPIGVGDAGGFAAGAYLPIVMDTKEAKNGGQYGMALRFPVGALDTEFGLYAMNYHSRTPILSLVKGNSPFPLTTKLLGAAASQESGFWEYPENVRLYGLSASTNIGSVAVGAEASYSPNFPVQLGAGDLLAGLVYGSAPAALAVLGVSAPVAALMNANRGPLNSRFQALANGQVLNGYDRLKKSQFQVNGSQFFNEVLGAETLTVVGEVGMQRVDVADSATGVRYGRAFVFGIATHPGYGPLASAVPGGCPVLNTPNQPGCENDGFVTKNSWGYRLRGQLAYQNAFNSGVTVRPGVFWGHDVSGVSADGQFNEGRGTLGLNLGFELRKTYSLELGYVTYRNSAKWDPLRDRDYYSASVSATF